VIASAPLVRHASAPAAGAAWMRKAFVFVAAAGACLLGAVSPAQAKAGDQAWAQCVWRTAPVSAANWLGMAAPSWSNDMETSSELLGHRLIAICSTEEANPRKPGHLPGWKSLAGTLRRARPPQAGAADLPDPAVQLCKSYATTDGHRTLYKMDVVRVSGTSRTTIFQQYFTEHDGKAVRMPQDIRMMLGADVATSTECKAISSTGSLENA
jgi:hypothetical protein